MQLPSVNGQRYNLQQLYQWYTDGSLVIPSFQRDFVWNTVQIKKWAEMIVDEISPLGVVVLYSIKNSKTLFLNDGRQRMEATVRAIDNPKKYGVTITSEEMYKKTARVQIDCQFIEVENTNQALTLFRMLNQGTTVSARG